ncbi:hypothetical protein V5799_022713 [Amblyomma americanum]|uniref:Uncharacterized protein n=1 Tax=Amblyomma americanum TaxID=6943 RepID=A0AAQ4FL54_AMBAM
MAAGNNTQEFEAAVGNMSLLLPADLVIRDVAVPSLSAHGFVRNHFRALSFEFDVREAKRRRGMPLVRDDVLAGARDDMWFMNETTLYVPAPAFALLSSNTTDSLLADAPVIAIRMAALMYYQTAYHTPWSKETAKAIASHSKCMQTSMSARYLYGAQGVMASTIGLHIAAAVVGAFSTYSSAVQVTPDWLDLKPAWSLYRMSKAQFFYTRYAYFRCGANAYSRSVVNEPLMLSPDFIRAFHCRTNPSAPSSIACANVTQDS